MVLLSLLFVAFLQGASADYGIGGHLGHLGLSHVGHVPYHGPVPHHNPVPVVHHVSVPYAHGFDYGHHQTEEVILTCAGTRSDTLAINILNKKSSPWFIKMGLDKQFGPRLEATINVNQVADIEFSVVLTELYNPLCDVNDLGHLVEPEAFLGYGAYSDSHPGHNYGFDGEHAHPIPGVLTTFENALNTVAPPKCEDIAPNCASTYGKWDCRKDVMNILLPFMEVNCKSFCGFCDITSQTLGFPRKHSIYIDRLYGFKSLSELAGRGVALCPKEQVKSDGHGHFECTPDNSGDNFALACCSLEYADKEQFIS